MSLNDEIPLLHESIAIDAEEEQVQVITKQAKHSYQSICFASLIILIFSLILISSITKGNPKPLLILVSLDGCKPDYLNLGQTPFLSELINTGFYTSIQPSFPSITFPNHVTLTSGLYPESHGIVGNTFYDPIYDDYFSYTDPLDDQDFKWWNKSEPVWITAEKNGLLAGNCFWPGSETSYGGKRSTYYKNYRNVPPTTQLSWVMSWLSKPESLRPSLITIYFPQIDHAGHGSGPNSDDVKTALRDIDGVIGELLNGLKEKGLWKVTNLVIVSDHGMGESSIDKVVFLDDYVNQNDFSGIINGPLWSLYPHGNISKFYSTLAKASSQPDSHFQVWLHDEIPSSLHYNSNRVGPILVLADFGYNFAFRKSFDRNKPPFPKGVHGWNITQPDMQAILIGNGPYFDGYPQRRNGVIKNVEVYGMLTDILKIKPNPNNGTGVLIRE